ncbi:MAG: hypothetical protein NZ740_09005 [Kiritimatiellae bacterium]|nr:hypothetical protein [Kiritimatiellia bacterium]MDW8459231.1 hypothetical protein [Verrucomicrobiota bacterium]
MNSRARILAAVLLAAASSALGEVAVVNRAISEKEVLAAQQAWGRGLVEIGEAFAQGGHAAAVARAEALIDSAYAYQLGAVLFKPTLTRAPHTFRTTREGALSYFIGGNPAFPEDTGFALLGWTHVEVENAAIYIDGDTATTMGKVRLTDRQGKITTVDKTWQFIKDEQGHLRIVVHHSSLEYDGPKN